MTSAPVTPSAGVAPANAAVFAVIAGSPAIASVARPGQLRKRRASYFVCATLYSVSFRSRYSADAFSPSLAAVRSTSIACSVRSISAIDTSADGPVRVCRTAAVARTASPNWHFMSRR
jgi:hypothetical protein